MKAPNKGNRPCPVLQEDGGDYLPPCRFSSTMECTSSPAPKDPPIYKYSISLDLHCPPLEKMIEEGKAKIVICLEQDTTRRFLDFEPGMEITVDASTLRLATNLDVTPLIISTSSFQLEFDPKFMDELYGLFDSRQFGIENCQILGYGLVIHLHTNAIRGLSQIVAIQEVKSRDKTHPFTLEYSQDKILIVANTEITQNIKLIQRNFTQLEGLVNAVLAYPVFYMVIEHMIDNPRPSPEPRWYSAILNKINKVRAQDNKPEFDPEAFATEIGESNRSGEIWTLVSQLLTDNSGQLMLMAFEKAGKYAEGI